MDELIKTLREKYAKDLTASLSIYKVAIFTAYAIAITVFFDKNEPGLWFELSSLHVSDILVSSNGLASKTTLLYLIYAVLLTIVTGYIYKEVRARFFNWFASLRNFDEYVERLFHRINSEVTDDQVINLYFVKDLKEEIKVKRAQLGGVHVWGEICLSGLAISLLGLSRPNLIDLIVFFVLLCLIWSIQYRSFIYYISKIVPILVTENAFLGKKISFIDGLQDK